MELAKNSKTARERTRPLKEGSCSSSNSHTSVSRRWFLEFTALSALAAACGSVNSLNGSGSAPVKASIGPVEKSELTVSFNLPSLNSQAPILIARERGFFAEAGFTRVEMVMTENIIDSLVSGKTDIGVPQTLELADAATKNFPLRMIGAYRNYRIIMIATHPEIRTANDLEGKEIVLATTASGPDYDLRVGLLKEAGWDITSVKVKPMAIPGASDNWVKMFLEKKIWMTPVFNRHKNQILAAGARLVVEKFQYGNDSLAATQTFVEHNPNTLARFIFAYIRGLRVWKDPANKDYVTSLAPKIGIKVTPAILDAYEMDIRQYDSNGPYDGGFDLVELRKYLTDELRDRAPDVTTLIAADPLIKAQTALGITPRPSM